MEWIFPLQFFKFENMKVQFNILFLVLFIGFSSFAQEEIKSEYSSDVFNSEHNGLNLLSSVNTAGQEDITQSRIYARAENNLVLIKQIGDFNVINTNTQSQSSNIELLQKGDLNSINIVVNAPSIETDIRQNGNNNSVIDNIYYTNLDVSLKLIQNGDNLSLNRIGVNSLSNKIQLLQEGNNKTITVISN